MGAWQDWIDEQSQDFQDEVAAARGNLIAEEWIATLADVNAPLDPSEWDTVNMTFDHGPDVWDITLTDNDGNTYNLSGDGMSVEDASVFFWQEFDEVLKAHGVDLDKEY